MAKSKGGRTANDKNNGMAIVTGTVAYPIVTPKGTEPLGYARSGGIAASATASRSGDCWRFEAGVTVTNPVIAKYLADGKAAVVLKVRCPGTSYRKTSRVDINDTGRTAIRPDGSFEASLTHDLPIDRTKTEAVIVVTPMVVMLKHVEDYSSPDFAREHAGMTYELMPGAKVAIGETLSVQAKDRTKQQIFRVRRIDSPDAREYDVDLNGETHVYIDLASNVYDAYRTSAYDPRLGSMLQRTILLPAMTEAVAKAARVIRAGVPVGERQPWVDAIGGIASKLCRGAGYQGFAMDEIGPDKRWTAMQVAQTLMPHTLGDVMGEFAPVDED